MRTDPLLDVGAEPLGDFYDEGAALRQTIEEEAQSSLRYSSPALALILFLEGLSHLSAYEEAPALVVVPLVMSALLAALGWFAWRSLPRDGAGLLTLSLWAATMVSIVQHLQIGQGAGTVLFLVVVLVVVAFNYLEPISGALTITVTSAVFVWACLEVFGPQGWLYPTLIVPMALIARSKRLNGLREAERRRRAEQELARREAEIVGLRRLRGVASGVAHHFNNLLTVMLGSASLLEKDVGSNRALRGRFEMLTEAGERASDLVQDLLLTVGDGIPVSPRSIAMEDLLRLPSDRSQWPEGVKLRFEVEAGLPDLHADERLLDRALAHVIENAAEAGGPGSEVVLRIGRGPSDTVRLTVIDEGPGFDDEALEHAFDPFWTTREPTRSGLGLACAKGLVEALGGRVHAANRTDGRGAEVALEVLVDQQA